MPKFKKNPNPIMKRSGFKMKGYSYPGTSPVKKVIWPPEAEGLDTEVGLIDDKTEAIARRRKLYESGEITKKQFKADKKEILSYTDEA